MCVHVCESSSILVSPLVMVISKKKDNISRWPLIFKNKIEVYSNLT